ncbi:hypothetical protein [Xylanibacter rodentium]|uniref:hypothetical protein n=1 Tax=Xylanibacter rodentium TaxID=2736289 RepID=UPI00259CE1F9|nr:hypothetical protein [Xylanibacter rodentium]
MEKVEIEICFGLHGGTNSKLAGLETSIVFKSRYKIKGSSSGCSKLLQAGTDVITSCTRNGTGAYTINHKLNTMNYILIIIGEKIIDGDYSAKVSLLSQTSNSFSVLCADDDTSNDSVFWVTILTF